MLHNIRIYLIMQTDVKAVTIIALKNKSMLSVLNQAKMLPVSHPLPTGYISENTRHMSYEEWDTLTSHTSILWVVTVVYTNTTVSTVNKSWLPSSAVEVV